jgi:cell volume regulation protein A
MMGRGRFVHRASLRLFHDGVAWLLQILMFIVLGLLVNPSQVVALAGFGVAVALFLMLIARPVSVFAALAGSGATGREKTFISWVGLRGAAPIILATFPLVFQVGNATLIFDIVFFIVVISSLVQGTTIPLSARLLGLEGEPQSRQAMPIEFVPTDTFDTEMAEFRVREGSHAAGKDIVQLGLPESALIMLISRDTGFILPKGGTSLKPGDTLLILAKRELLPEIREVVEGVSARQSHS